MRLSVASLPLVGWVARTPARLRTKLLIAFLSIVGLLLLLGVVALEVLRNVNQQSDELVRLQRKVAAYRQVQHDTTNQLYGISTALLFGDDRMLEAALRQLGQFRYDLDRLEFVAAEEAETIRRARSEFEALTALVTRIVALARAGDRAEAQKLHLEQSSPVADRLERLTNQLVNMAEADMVTASDTANRAYRSAQIAIAGIALASILLALGLGYVISSTVIGPIALIEGKLRRIGEGRFTGHVDVENRDELGDLAANVNRTSDELGRLYREIEARSAELSEALQQQTATAEVLKSISRTTFDLTAVLRTLAVSARDLCNASQIVVFLLDGKTLRPAMQIGFTPEFEQFMRENELKVSRASPMGRAVLTGAICHVPDVLADPQFRLFDAQAVGGYRASLAVPLKRDDKVIGVFALARPVPEPFTAREIELVQTFSHQAVIAIENVRLFEEVQQRNRELTEALEQQTATSTILRAIASSPTDIQPVLDTVAESAAKLCQAFDAVIFLREGDALAWKAHYGGIPMDFESRPIGRDWVTGRAFLERKPLHLHDVSLEGEEFPLSQSDAARLGNRTLLAIPLLAEGEAIGVVAIRRVEVAPFTQQQIELLSTFADQAVIAIQNVRLFEEVQARTRELAEALQQQTATAEVLKTISRSTFELDTVLEALVTSAAQLCNSHYGGIYLRDGEQLIGRAAIGPSPDDLEELKTRPVEIYRGSIAGRVALSGQLEHIPDILQDPDYDHARFAKYGDFRALLGVPLLQHGRVEGVFFLGRSEPGGFTQRQAELVQTFADQAVIAIQNVRLFEQVQARTRDLARKVSELRALGDVSQAVNSTLDLETVLKTIVAKAVQLSGTDAGAIYVFSDEHERFRLRATYGMSEELISAISQHEIGLGDPGVGEAARKRRPIQTPDLAQIEVSRVQAIVLEAGFRSVLVIPMLRGDAIVGALVVRRRDPGEFAPSTVELLETFAAQSVVAVQNARLFSEVEEKGRQLEVASRHKSQFLANMSHELRTPLNSVLGFSEMLADGLYGDLPERAKQTLGRIQANGKHLLGLINDVLDLSKIEAGQLVLQVDDYAVSQVVRTVATATEPLARAKGLQLSAEVADGLPLGRGDERRLTQVLLNLAGNAVKFTDAGFVRIAADASDGRFVLTVEDSGPGIAPEHQARIFEEFQQVDDSSTRKKGGTGLGLAISKRIVEMHGGSIEVDSTPGVGSRFRVLLPISAQIRMQAA